MALLHAVVVALLVVMPGALRSLDVVEADADQAVCPGSRVYMHASAQVAAIASTSCRKVLTEILARVDRQPTQQWKYKSRRNTSLLARVKAHARKVTGNRSLLAVLRRRRVTWIEPHGNGTYAVTAWNKTQVNLTRTSADGKFTDKIVLTLHPFNGGCEILGCSESQVFSIRDQSTNFCNIRSLICGSADGCKSVKNDFIQEVTSVVTSVGAGSDPSRCVATPTDSLAMNNTVRDTEDALDCVSSRCPLDDSQLIPSRACILLKCAGPVFRAKCFERSICWHALDCVMECTAQIAESDDAPRLAGAANCLGERCPGLVPTPECAQRKCGRLLTECGNSAGCKNTYQCTRDCFYKNALGLGRRAFNL